jgi:hypothetical protein
VELIKILLRIRKLNPEILNLKIIVKFVCLECIFNENSDINLSVL